ncbi:MAG: thioredoxin family protein [bacterium]|nr:thioredoxin family protein [bacterium]
MKKIIKLSILLFTLILLTSCGKGSLKEITYSDLEEKIKNEETFILEVVQDGCHNCESFTPKLKEIIKKYDINIVQINLTNLSEEDTNNLNNIFNVSGTPTVIFITNGKEESISKRIVGNVSKDKIISKFKKANYIK